MINAVHTLVYDGLTATLKIPGAGEMMLYQARHPVAYSL
jgi:hypothetical protein